jgi:hypothetical protein
VHHTRAPFADCDEGGTCHQPPIIHNINIDGFSHSGVFLTEIHSRLMWLPLFWRATPKQYAGFVLTCEEIATLWNGGFRERSDEQSMKLLDEPSPWFGPGGTPSSFRSFLDQRLRDIQVDATYGEITRSMAFHFIAAWQARDREARRCIRPDYAANAAINAILGRA